MIPIEEFKNDDELSGKIGSTIDVFQRELSQVEEKQRFHEIKPENESGRRWKKFLKLKKR